MDSPERERHTSPPSTLPLVTAAEMRELDRRATDEFGVPSLLLMENAGAAIARAARKMLAAGRVLVVAGRGNNGGDGFVAARHLDAAGYDVRVLLAAPEERVQGDARANLEMCRRAGIAVTVVASAPERPEADLIVDALLGTGLKGAVKGLAAEKIGRAHV